MERSIAEQYQGKIVRIKMTGDFVPPPGIIIMITNDSFMFETKTKTSVLSLKDLQEINPVVK